MEGTRASQVPKRVPPSSASHDHCPHAMAIKRAPEAPLPGRKRGVSESTTTVQLESVTVTAFT